MRVLLIGASGQVGGALAAAFAGPNELLASAYQHPRAGQVLLDLSDQAAATALLERWRPDVVLLAAAMCHVDRCEQEPDACRQINVLGPIAVAEYARRHGVSLVFFSTDHVFDGAQASYRESDEVHPLSVYARSKAEAEAAIRDLIPTQHLIIRTNFYGWSSGRKRTFAERIYGSLERRVPIRLLTDVWFTPMYVVDLAHRLEQLIETGARGLIHVAGHDRMSKYEFGLLLARTAGFPTDLITPGDLAEGGLKTPRPKDMSLASLRCESLIGLRPPGCAEGLRRFLRDRERPLSHRADTSEQMLLDAMPAAPGAEAAR